LYSYTIIQDGNNRKNTKDILGKPKDWQKFQKQGIDLGLSSSERIEKFISEEIKYNNNLLFIIKQFRKKKRSLHEATARKGRKTPNSTSKRNSKNSKESNGFYLNDKVSAFGKIGYITGFTSGGAYIKGINNEYITIPEKTYKQVSFKNIKFICHNNNWQYIASAG